MYLHLGKDEIVPEHSVIGIFDLDQVSYGKRGREYLSRAEEEGVVLDVSGDLPKSFVVCRRDGRTTVYISQISTATLLRRASSLVGGW